MKYRKKPIIIEAFQMTKARRESNFDWPQWLHEAWNKDKTEPGALFPSDFPHSDGTDKLMIRTLEGDLLVEWDAFIILV